MARPLPNPNKHDERTLTTLKNTLFEQEETNKWSRNVDTNTYRSSTEMEKIHKDFTSNFSVIIGQGKEALLPENDKQLTFMEGILEAFDVITKPFKKAAGPIESFGKNITDGSEGVRNINKGFKELTNGIGALGPIMNTLKNVVYKVIGAWNIFVGALQVIGSAFKIFLLKPLLFLWRLFRKMLPEVNKGPFAGGKKAAQEGVRDSVKSFKSGARNIGNKLTFGKMFKPKDEEGEEGEDGEASGGDGGGIDERLPPLLQKIHEVLMNHSSGHAHSQEVAQKQRDRMISLLEGGDNKKGGKIWVPNAKAEKAKLTFWQKMERKKNKFVNKFIKNEFLQRKKNDMKIFAIQKLNEVKKFAMFLLKFLMPVILLGAAFLYLKDKIDGWAEAPFAGLAKAGEIVVKKIGSIFSSLKAGLAKMFPRIFAPKVDPKPKPKPKVKTNIKPTSVASGADDAAKGGAKALAKTVGKGVLKRIPLIGAGVEGAIDAKQNEDKFGRIKEAYENQTPIIEDETTGELRPLTKEEFEAAEASMTANRAGSAGRTGGAWAGAATGAAAGAAIGSVIPFVGTAIGGIIGGVLGGFWGARAGDDIATNLANQAEGVDNPQDYIDNLAANLPDLASEQGQDLANANIDVADAELLAADGGGGNSAIAVQTDNSVRSESHYTGGEPIDDSQLGYSTAS